MIGASSRGGLARDYLALTKPRIIVLLLVTALGGMFVAAGGVPDGGVMAVVLIAGSLAAGGANAINHSLDRDIDHVMRRTRGRPVAGGRIVPRDALIFGVALNVAAFALLAALANPLSAGLTASATIVYVFVYTLGLKRSTPQNIVIGGAAGAFPPMVGWAAVSGDLGLAALYMFAIVFFWTPPHFWALALMIRDDYSEAGIPMLPVVTGEVETKRTILLYVALLTALTVMFVVTREVGLIYGISAAVLGAGYLIFAVRLLVGEGISGARGAYLYSLAYLALLFAALMVDASVR